MDLKDMQIYVSIYNQDYPFRGHPKSRATQPTHRDLGMHERFLMRLGVNCGPFVRTMPSLPLEKYNLSKVKVSFYSLTAMPNRKCVFARNPNLGVFL